MADENDKNTNPIAPSKDTLEDSDAGDITTNPAPASSQAAAQPEQTDLKKPSKRRPSRRPSSQSDRESDTASLASARSDSSSALSSLLPESKKPASDSWGSRSGETRVFFDQAPAAFTTTPSTLEGWESEATSEMSDTTSSSETSSVADSITESEEDTYSTAGVMASRTDTVRLKNRIDDDIIQEKMSQLFEEKNAFNINGVRDLLEVDLYKEGNHRQWIETMSRLLKTQVPVGLESMSPEQQTTYAMSLKQSIRKIWPEQGTPTSSSSHTESIDTASTYTPVQPVPMRKRPNIANTPMAEPSRLRQLSEHFIRWTRGIIQDKSSSNPTESFADYEDLIDTPRSDPHAVKPFSETFSDDSTSESGDLEFSAVGPKPQSDQGSMADRLKNLGGSFEDLGTSGSEIPTQDSSDGPSEPLTSRKLADDKTGNSIEKSRPSQTVQGTNTLTDDEYKKIIEKIRDHLGKEYEVDIDQIKGKLDFSRKNPPPPRNLSVEKENSKLRIASNLPPVELAAACAQTGQNPLIISKATPENAKALLNAFDENHDHIRVVIPETILQSMDQEGQEAYVLHQQRHAANKNASQKAPVQSSPASTAQPEIPANASSTSTPQAPEAIPSMPDPQQQAAANQPSPNVPSEPDTTRRRRSQP